MIYDDAQDALAAEYVLGTLSGDEREHAEALLEIDPGFAESVRLWERRLGELNVMVEAVEPPPAVWEKISKEIGYVAPASASSIAPAETAAAIPPADARPFQTDETPMPALAEEAKHEPTAAMPPAEQLPDAVSELHYGFAGQVACRVAGRGYSASAPRAGQDRADSECRAQRQCRAALPARQTMA